MGSLIYGRLVPVSILLFLFLACAGSRIDLANGKGVYHRIKRGQTLGMIARAYHLSVLDLAVANSIEDPDYIEADRVIFIPGATRVVDDVGAVKKEDAAAKALPLKDEEAKGQSSARHEVPEDAEGPPQISGKSLVTLPPGGEKIAAPGGLHPSPQERPAGPTGPSAIQGAADGGSERQRFSWPVKGKVTSRFGRQPDGMYYNGIDIAAQEGDLIRASANGRVTFSAYLKDYGETIIIQHGDHFATVYTHLGRRMVKQQDQIKKGDQIALLGKPGKRGDAYVNFGIWYKNLARDPLLFLP